MNGLEPQPRRVRRSTTVVLFLLACLAFTGISSAATWYVAVPPLGNDGNPGSATLPFRTIRTGILATSAGDTVLIGNGTYTGEGNRDLEFMGKAITVRSRSGDRDSCLLDAQGSVSQPHVGFRFAGGETPAALLRDITISGGYPAGITIANSASGIPSIPTIRKIVLQGNPGAGLQATGTWSSDPVRIDSSLMRGNGAEGLRLSACTFEVMNCVVQMNGTAGAMIGGNAHGELLETRIFDNVGPGVKLQLGGAGPSVRIGNCDISGNDGWGVLKNNSEDNVRVESSVIQDNGLGGINVTGNCDYIEISNTDVLYNRGPGIRFGTVLSDFFGISDCRIIGNTGDGIYASFLGTAVDQRPKDNLSAIITGCVVSENTGMGIRLTGGLVQTLTLSGNLLIENSQGGLWLGSQQWGHRAGYVVNTTTIARNGGHGVTYASLGVSCNLENTIIADNAGQSLQATETGLLKIANSDFHGNVGGDWPGTLAPYLGLNGNLADDPLFCSTCQDDYGLAANSPCAAANNPVGIQMGLLPVACGAHLPSGTVLRIDVQPDAADAAWTLTGPECYVHEGRGDETMNGMAIGSYSLTWHPSGDWVLPVEPTPGFTLGPGQDLKVTGVYGAGPVIQTITDVDGDQGRQVLLTWRRSVHDSATGDPLVTGYGIYRRQGSVKQGSVKSSAPADADLEDGAAQIAGWDYLAAVPASADSHYQYVAPTLGDSTDEQGAWWSVFMVSALTSVPTVFFDSRPDSGCSVDNLVPSVPAGLRLEAGALLVWDPSPDADFRHFKVYGATTDHRNGSETLIAATTGTSLAVGGLAHRYYLVSATDQQGNESATAVLGAASAVGPSLSLRLLPCQPNPFNPSTLIVFELPRGEPVRLAIYDLGGHVVRVLLDESRAAGFHEVHWDGLDGRGRMASSGVYVCRLEAGAFRGVQRMTLVK